jgi:hypothetical protein
LHLNDTAKAQRGDVVFDDANLQMAGYAAALKILTAYTHIDGENVTDFALRPRVPGEVTVVDEIIYQAIEIAANLLVPQGLSVNTWTKLANIERFVLRMLDMETTSLAKLSDYQNFASAFCINDYSNVMSSVRPGYARLKCFSEYTLHNLADTTEIGKTRLGRLIIAIQQLCENTQPLVIIDQLRSEMSDFSEIYPMLVDMLAFIECKSPEIEVCRAAEVLGAHLKNLRFGN